MLLAVLPTAVFAGSVTRTAPSSATGTVVVTYTLTGFTGTYGILIDDDITGGCTLSDGTTRFTSIMMNPETTKTITLNMPSTGSCTIAGEWDFGTTQHGDFPNTIIAVEGTSGCTNGATQACTITNCPGTSTCSGGVWGTCAKTDSTCGIGCTPAATAACTVGTCAGTKTCSSAGAWGSCVKTVSTCGDDTCDDPDQWLCGVPNIAIIIGGFFLLIMLVKSLK